MVSELSLVCSTFNRRRRGDPPVGSAATGADKMISPPQPISKITNNKTATERLVFGYRMEVSFNPEPKDDSFFADYVAVARFVGGLVVIVLAYVRSGS